MQVLLLFVGLAIVYLLVFVPMRLRMQRSIGEELRIRCEDGAMQALYFQGPGTGDVNVFVVAPKTGFASPDDFIAEALAFADAEEGGQAWTEKYADLDRTPAEPGGDRWKLPFRRRRLSGNQLDKKAVTIIMEPVVSVVDLGPQEDSDRTCVLETDTDYIFFHFQVGG